MSLMTVYHGSSKIIKLPEYGVGGENNDYGKGFYLTEYSYLAGEWAVLWTRKNGYINEYAYNTGELFSEDIESHSPALKILTLDSLSVESWIAVLLDNREGDFLEDPISEDTAVKFKHKYLPALSEYDIITGWRADDSYFRYAEDFVAGRLSLENLEKALKFGDLGQQICIKSEDAFDKRRWEFVTAHNAKVEHFYRAASNRDSEARKGYSNLIKDAGARSGTLIDDLLRIHGV